MNLDHLYDDKEGFLLVDLSQISLATCMQTYEDGTKFTVPEIRHMILSTLKHNVMKFKHEGYNKVAICVDNAKFGYWRRQFADYYKRNRAISREEKKDKFDWEGYFEALAIVIQELKEFMPYFVLDVKFCEADDCIAVLTKYLSEQNYKVRIVSSDGDFTQLHKYEDVDQYSPIQKKFVKVKTSCPAEDCLTKILKGDKKDCVASIKVKGDFYLSDIVERTPMTSTDFVSEMLNKSDDELFEAFKSDVQNKLLSVKSGKKWIQNELFESIDSAEEIEFLLDSKSKEELIEIVHKNRIKYNLITFYGMDADKVSSIVDQSDLEKLVTLVAKIRMKRFEENRVLIDFDYIRDDIKTSILEEFKSYKPAPRGKMYSYFVKSGLTKLLKDINSF